MEWPDRGLQAARIDGFLAAWASFKLGGLAESSKMARCTIAFGVVARLPHSGGGYVQGLAQNAALTPPHPGSEELVHLLHFPEFIKHIKCLTAGKVNSGGIPARRESSRKAWMVPLSLERHLAW